jgi:hypothetical protein
MNTMLNGAFELFIHVEGHFLMKSLDFSIDLILPAATRSWGRVSF